MRQPPSGCKWDSHLLAHGRLHQWGRDRIWANFNEEPDGGALLQWRGNSTLARLAHLARSRHCHGGALQRQGSVVLRLDTSSRSLQATQFV